MIVNPKGYLAVVQTPLGVWESTACVCTGHEAEYRAKRQAQRAFMKENLPPFMTQYTDSLVDFYWRAAERNGCLLIVKEVDLTAT